MRETPRFLITRLASRGGGLCGSPHSRPASLGLRGGAGEEAEGRFGRQGSGPASAACTVRLSHSPSAFVLPLDVVRVNE